MANTPQQARQASSFNAIALTVLVGRAGGILEIPIEEFEEIVERYGGKGNATLFAEYLDRPGAKKSVRVTLVNKKPRQGELPV